MAQAKRKAPSGKLAVGPSRRDQAVLDNGGIRCDSVVYDFSADGGATGEYDFGRVLPEGAIVTRVITDELTAVAGATDMDIAVGATALVSAIDFTADSGIQSRALDGAADGIKVPANGELTLTINTTAATAGKVRIFVEYLLPTD